MSNMSEGTPQGELVEAADRVTDLLRDVMDSATRPRKSMPTYGECEEAVIAYAAAKDKIRR